MPLDRKLNKSRKRAKVSRADQDGRARHNDIHASMRESVNLTPLPGPSGVAEASDATDRNPEIYKNFPASTQDSAALEPLQGEMNDNFHGDAAANSPGGLTAHELRRAGLTSETIWEKVAAREERARKSRFASLQVPPIYYHVGGGVAEPPRGRKRASEAGNEPSSRSSSSSESSLFSGSRASQPPRSSLIGLGDGGEGARRTAGVS
jgi:hypothetical protein